MRFDCLDASYELLEQLRRPLAEIRKADSKLHSQLRTAAASISLNIAEGRGRVGKDRTHHWRIAHGSAEEVRAILRVAEALGDLEAGTCSRANAILDRVLQMLWRMTR